MKHGSEDHPFSSQKTISQREIIDNAYDIVQVKNVKNKYVEIIFHKDNSMTVKDNGGGIPVSLNKKADGTPASSLYLALGVLRAGSNFDVDSEHYTRGTNGLGGSATNMLSEYLHAKVYKDNKEYSLSFKDGVPGEFKNDKFIEYKDLTKLIEKKDTRSKEEKALIPSGTYIHSKLNSKVFKSEYPVDRPLLIELAKGTAYHVPKLRIKIIDEIDNKEYEFYFEHGFQQIIKDKSHDSIISEPIVLVGKGNYKNDDRIDNYEINIGLDYNSGYESEVESYVNTIKTRLNGIHTQAFETALTNVFAEKFRSIRGLYSGKDPDPNWNDIREGLNVVVSVNVVEPEFTSQIKEELGGTPLKKAMIKSMEDILRVWVNKPANRSNVEKIGAKIYEATKNRIKIQEQKEIQKKTKEVTRTAKMPAKLVDCQNTYQKGSELFICEGDSALGGLKRVRSSKFQALFPIRGKILNVLKASQKDILANQETQDIIKCLDCGFGKNSNADNARYEKIILASDADVDGDAIGNLLITWFWKMAPDFIHKGKLFRMMTPLYEIVADKSYFCMTQDEKKKKEAELEKKKIKVKEIKRFKGLGESGDKVLRETGMNPETRFLQQITLKDIKKAEEMIELISGDNADDRKKWITDNPYRPEIILIDK